MHKRIINTVSSINFPLNKSAFYVGENSSQKDKIRFCVVHIIHAERETHTQRDFHSEMLSLRDGHLLP